jgi:hypothetical protein
MPLSQYPRLHRALLAALADADWASGHSVAVTPLGSGLVLAIGANGRARKTLLPAAVESRPDVDSVVRAAVAEIRAELVPGG